MPAYHAHAVVLRKTKLGESDLILTLLASDGSQVRAVAKGVRKTRSKFGGRLEPYSVVDLLLHTGRTLDVVAEAETIAAHPALREDYDRASAASVVADVLDKVSCEGQTDERLFGLALASLESMETAEGEGLVALVDAFLVKAMALSGYRPQLESCTACAGEVRGEAFSLAAGGVVCDACGETEPGAVTLSYAGRSVLAALLRARMADVSALGVPVEALAECLGLLKAFVAYHVPGRMKALEAFGR